MTILIIAIAVAIMVAVILLVRRSGSSAATGSPSVKPEHPDPWVRHGIRGEAQREEGRKFLFPKDPDHFRAVPLNDNHRNRKPDILQ